MKIALLTVATLAVLFLGLTAIDAYQEESCRDRNATSYLGREECDGLVPW